MRRVRSSSSFHHACARRRTCGDKFARASLFLVRRSYFLLIKVRREKWRSFRSAKRQKCFLTTTPLPLPKMELLPHRSLPLSQKKEALPRMPLPLLPKKGSASSNAASASSIYKKEILLCITLLLSNKAHEANDASSC